MFIQERTKRITQAAAISALLLTANFASAQTADSTKQVLNLSGTISANNNGFVRADLLAGQARRADGVQHQP